MQKTAQREAKSSACPQLKPLFVPGRGQTAPDYFFAPKPQPRPSHRAPFVRGVPRRCLTCEKEGDAQRVAQRVDSDSDHLSLEFPREVGEVGEMGEAGETAYPTPAPAPPVFPPQPPPPVEAAGPSCCEKALSAGLDAGDWGGIICCKNTKRACVWQSNINKKVKNSKAQTIIGKCVRVHEDTHVNQVDCTGADVERPPFKAGVDPKKAECTAYKAEAKCYEDTIDKCGTDATCRQEVQTEWDFAKKQIKKFC